MSPRPSPQLRIDLLGVVTVKKRRGPGYVVGEIKERRREGEAATGLVRARYYDDVDEALKSAAERARGLYVSKSRTPEGLARFLEATAHALAALAKQDDGLHDEERRGR